MDCIQGLLLCASVSFPLNESVVLSVLGKNSGQVQLNLYNYFLA